MSSSLSSFVSRFNSSKDLDLVVFGATGFTGQFVIEEVWRTQAQIQAKTKRPLRWAIAGRSKQKLDEKLNILKGGNRNTPKGVQQGSIPEVLIADVSTEESIKTMTQRAHVLLNCVGPFNRYGEAVVKACIASRTDYVDITGELRYMAKTLLQYADEAKQNGVSIVHACGFDSVPADMGVVLATRALEEQNALPASVDMFLSLHPGTFGAIGNAGTYRSAVGEIVGHHEQETLERAINRKYPTHHVGPSTSPISLLSFSTFYRGWTVPCLAVDKFVVTTSQRLIQQQRHELGSGKGEKHSNPVVASISSLASSVRGDLADASRGQLKPHKSSDSSGHLLPPAPVYFEGYALIPLLYLPIVLGALGIVVFTYFASRFEFSRRLLLAHPGLSTLGVFSEKGPSLKHIESTHFVQRLIARGYSADATSTDLTDLSNRQPDVKVIVEVKGRDPGYIATVNCLVQTAYVLLDSEQRNLIPNGVLTPGAAFWKTDLIQRLNENGVSIKVVSS